MSNPLALDLESVSHTYRSSRSSRRALVDVSVSVPTGAVVALLGDNGAGKSTLLSVSAGLVEPDEGSVRVMGESLGPVTTRSRGRVGFVAQGDCVYPVLTVRQNLSFVCRLAGLSGRRLAERLNGLAGRFGLLGLMNTKAASLSGGQRRRLDLAMSLAHAPPLLLLDEPSVGLDQVSRGQLIEVVSDLADQGVGVLYSTHHLDEVEALNAEVVILDEGRIIQTGSVSELIDSYAPPLIELVFDSHCHDLPPQLAGSIETVTTSPEGWLAVTSRLASSRDTVSGVLELLEPKTRSAVLSAVVRPPELATAYRRILRIHGVKGPELVGMETL